MKCVLKNDRGNYFCGVYKDRNWIDYNGLSPHISEAVVFNIKIVETVNQYDETIRVLEITPDLPQGEDWELIAIGLTEIRNA